MKKHIDDVIKEAIKPLFKWESSQVQVIDQSVYASREALKRHEHNNFQPLLDALKRASDRQGFSNSELIEARKRIKDAEQVEVPE